MMWISRRVLSLSGLLLLLLLTRTSGQGLPPGNVTNPPVPPSLADGTSKTESEKPADTIVPVKELEGTHPLYINNSVIELLGKCTDVRKEDLIEVPGKEFRECPNTTCIKFCNEDRLDKLRVAQNRVRNMLLTLQTMYKVMIHVIAFFMVVVLGMYLTFVNQFNWKTLPWIWNQFEYDPTDGYRYSHYMWMQWIILDSDHPTYYLKMTPDAQELEYTPQRFEWKDREVDKEDEVRPSWDIKDIYKESEDPSERLDMYFKRVGL